MGVELSIRGALAKARGGLVEERGRGGLGAAGVRGWQGQGQGRA